MPMSDLLTRDAFAAVAWGAVNLLLAAAGWRLSRRVAPADPPIARLLHAAVFGWATVVGVATLLGLCQALTPAASLVGVAVVAVVALRCAAGGGHLCSAAAGLAVVATYVVARQTTNAENDVAAAGLLMAGVCYALRHTRSGGRGDLLLGAAAVGLLAGVKYYALGYGFVAGV